jgi:general secretion pathway protein G
MINKKEKGFTLIEMLVVIVVIGILSTIVLVSVSSGRKKAQATKAKTTVSELSKAIEMAATEGCRKVTLSAGALSCTPPSAASAKTYATADPAPGGIKYTFYVGGVASASVSDSTAGGSGAWAGSLTDVVINSGYSFGATGFADGGTFECNDGSLTGHTRSGCACSVADGCTTTQ